MINKFNFFKKFSLAILLSKYTSFADLEGAKIGTQLGSPNMTWQKKNLELMSLAMT